MFKRPRFQQTSELLQKKKEAEPGMETKAPDVRGARYSGWNLFQAEDKVRAKPVRAGKGAKH